MSNDIKIEIEQPIIEINFNGVPAPTPGGNPAWNDIAGKPSAFPPSAHTHPWDTGISGKPDAFPPSSHAHTKDQITDFPTIPDAQIQSDWNQADDTKKDFIKNKPVSGGMLGVKTIGTAGSGADFECPETAAQTTFTTAVESINAGDTLKVLAGTYNFGGAVTVNKSITIEGADRTLVIINVTGNTNAFIVSATGCVFTRLGITTGAGQTVATPMIKISNNVLATNINNCYLACRIGIEFGDTNPYTRISENQFAYSIDNSSTYAIDMPIGKNGNYGIIIDRNVGIVSTFLHVGTYCTFYQSVIEKNKIICGLFADIHTAMSNSNIINNAIIVQYSPAILLTDGGYGTACEGLIISGNNLTAYGTVNIGMQFEGIKYSNISNNIFKGFGVDNIQLKGNGTNNSTYNNIIGNNIQSGTISGGITEADSSQDYNKYVNNIAGTVTTAGIHSVDKDKANSTISTTAITANSQVLAANSRNANISATQSYSVDIAPLTDGQKVSIANIRAVDSYTKLYLPMNNSAVDMVGHTLSATNDMTYTNQAGEYKWGYSGIFNGSTSSIIFQNSSDFTLAGDLTVELWFKPSSISARNEYLIGSSDWNNGSQGFNLVLQSNGQLEFDIDYTAGVGYKFDLSVASGMSNGNWYHIAAVRNGANVKLYVNGISIGSGTDSPIHTTASTNPLYIGRFATRDNGVTGKIDDVRISACARYTSNFSVPTIPLGNSITITPASGKRIYGWTTGVDKNIILSNLGQCVELIADTNGDIIPTMLVGDIPLQGN